MKWLKWILPVLILLALALAAGSLPASADGPLNSSPTTATYIDNQSHQIPGNTVYWFRFYYWGENSPVTVSLVHGAGTQMRFDVYTPDQMTDLRNEKPIGRGTLYSYNCNAGIPLVTGGCQGDDLRWMGKFPAEGMYYVELFNDNPAAQSFTLTVEGDLVVQCVQPGSSSGSGAPLCSSTPLTPTPVAPPPPPPTLVPTPIPVVHPPVVNAPNTFSTDPYHALPMPNQPQIIAANSSIWYRFEYAGDGSNIVLRLQDGLYKGLDFSLYVPDQAADWWNTPPIGRGTVSTCGKSQLDNPDLVCGPNANDMLWSGKFVTNGTYFVQVTNPTLNPVQFLLTVEGTGVSLCGPSGQVSSTGPNFLPCPVSTQGTIQP